jgi:[acyl-carrier-protein] S-malonyltransferase
MDSFPLLAAVDHTAFLFPGQGSQHVGMARELAEAYPAARAALEEADAVLGFALSRLMFDGPEADLTDTVNAQPALLAASVAALRALAGEWGHTAEQMAGAVPGPAVFVAGHSLGEYTALVAAGSLSYADGLRLVRERGRLMKEAGARSPGKMAAILGLDEDKVAAVCAAARDQGGIVQVANDNCPGQVVISGDEEGMEAAMGALAAAGARKVMPLAVSIAAHSPLMQPAIAALESAVKSATFHLPQVPVIANTTAQPLVEISAIQDELVDQLTGSVRWTATIQALAEAGVTTFVEVGPGEVLTGLVKRIARGAERINVNDPASVQAFVARARKH